MAGGLLYRCLGRWAMALRLRYQIDSPRRLRERVHLGDGTGYFFFPGAIAPKGAVASLEVDFSSSTQVALLRGWVWARASGGGLWLELAGAQRCLDKMEGASKRSEVRLASDQLVLAEPDGLAALLCRLRDVSPHGARLVAVACHRPPLGHGLPEARPDRAAGVGRGSGRDASADVPLYGRARARSAAARVAPGTVQRRTGTKRPG